MRVARLVVVLLLAVGPGPSAAQSAAELSGKPVAPFTLAAEAVAAPVLGVPVDVRITVETRAELADIEVRVSPDEGLSLDVADYTLYAPSATPDRSVEWVISVVPVKEGAHRLLLFGEALVGGARQGRSAVATIRVGGDAEGSRAGEASGAGRGTRADSDSTVQSADAASSDDGEPSTMASRSRAGVEPAGDPRQPGAIKAEQRAGPVADRPGPRADATEPVAERVIRLPATVRP